MRTLHDELHLIRLALAEISNRVINDDGPMDDTEARLVVAMDLLEQVIKEFRKREM